MKKKKVIENKEKKSERFFFSVPKETALWLKNEANKQYVEPSIYLRSLVCKLRHESENSTS